MPDKEADDLGQVDELEIRFDADPAVYREGDSVTGMLHIKNSNDVKYKGKCLSVCLSLYLSLSVCMCVTDN